MMSFGIITYDKDGGVNFRGEGQTFRVIHHQTVSRNFTGNIPIEGVSPERTVAYCTPRRDIPFDRNLLVSVGEGFINLSRFNNSYPPLTDLDLTVISIR